jgi:DNA-binding MarR family transcriptional regulator
MKKGITLSDYRSLAEVRYQIRRFLHFSEQVSRSAGLEPRQYQLMLAIKGLPPGVRPRIGELAERLQIQHHSAVELVNRLGIGGFVRRQRGGQDRREVWVSLTSRGEQTLRELALHHREELRSSAPALLRALKRVVRGTKDPLVVKAQKEAISRAAAKRKMSTSKGGAE